jgi:2-keto-3-deoxy-L-rhamnonate aldolase RhmA
MLVALGIPGQINDPKINEMRESVARVARKHNKIAATVCNPDTVLGFADMGYNLSSLAADVVVLSEYADKMIEAFDKV